MSRNEARGAVVMMAALIATHVLPVMAADASGTCGTGPSFATATTGTLDREYEDWWQTVTTGPTEVTVLTGPETSAYVTVYDASCNYVCAAYGYPARCTTPSGGLFNIAAGIEVSSPVPTLYTITALSSGTPSPSCSAVGVPPVCVGVSTGPVVQTVDVYGAQIGTAATHHVAGTVDVYRFALPTGGTTTLPCVVLTVGATTSNVCQAMGGTFVSRVATLVDQTAEQPSAGLGPPLLTVRVCEATLTIMVAGVGVQDASAYSLC